ncbi:DNA/RNA non-specific endonuclease [Isoptericola halotolerans]|uniref:DNA/RNA non-specific endonuclease n=1 Tax=Isoptericola halotolerans TaxID=300560 RepID=UPI00389076AF
MTGYDAQFLGTDPALHVPLPAADRELRRLDHPHFSILLDPVRRLAAATVCAVDGDRLRSLPRTGSWRLDPQAPPEEQAGNELYRHNPLDRGHLVRRLDPMWGPEAREAGEATFVYPNAAPQVDEFNQSKELWNGLEDHVLAYAGARRHRLVVQTGCVFLASDPVYRGVAIPRQFWKVVAWTSPDGGTRPDGGTPGVPPALRSAAFVLDQTPQLTDAELSTATGRALAVGHVPPLGPYRAFQVPVADVETLTGLDLGRLAGADVRGPAPRRPLEPRTASRRPPSAWTLLTTPAEIALVPVG